MTSWNHPPALIHPLPASPSCDGDRLAAPTRHAAGRPLCFSATGRPGKGRPGEVSAMAGMVTTVDQLQSRFLTVLPRVERHARIHCHNRCPQTRDDQIAEAVALAWSWFRRLALKGIDA